MLEIDKKTFEERCKAFNCEEQKIVVETLPTSVLMDELTRRVEKYDVLVDKLETLYEGLANGK